MTHHESAYTLLFCIVLAGLILLLGGCESPYEYGVRRAKIKLDEQKYDEEVSRGYADYMKIHNKK